MKNGSLMVVCCVAVAWSAAADTAFDAVKASCRRQLGCGDERIREVVRFSEALIGEADAAKWSGCEWQKANDERAARLVATQRDDGSWPDVDYVNMTRSMFNAVRHLYNMRAIARSPRTPEKERALHKALAFWLDGGFQNPNWWWNKIGVPLPLGTVALLMDDILSAEERDRVVKALRVSKIYMTAQNRVWFAECVLYRALLEGNEEDVKAAHAAILDELKISRTVEGIQTDWSFHQHGNQAQFGNYGASYISAMTRLLAIFDGTPWAVPDERRQVLEKLVVNGYMPIVWRGALDMGALGRRIGPGVARTKGALALNVAAALGVSTNVPAGLHWFPKSACGVYRGKGWMASMKCETASIIGKERGNNDNLLGAHFADGALFTYVTGDEYRDVFPLWNWRHIPGITSYDVKTVDWKSRNRNEVGARDGNSVRFVLNRAGLRATTVWRFSDEGVDVSVTEISSKKDDPVVTTVEQSIAQPGAKWWREKDGIVAVNGAIRYELPSNAIVRVEERTGSWNDCMEELSDEKVSGRIFEIVVPHGRSPAGASCSWRVRPLAGPGAFAGEAVAETKLIANGAFDNVCSAHDGGRGAAALSLVPRGDDDRTAEVLAAVKSGATLRFAKGEYHFRSPTKLCYYISNHDNPQPHSVFLPVTNVTDFAMRGDGAVFVFHGSGVGLTLMDTRRVTMKGIAFEWARPPFSEAKVVKSDDGGIVLRSDPKRFPLSVERGRLIAVGEGWKNHVPLIEAFDGETLDPVMGVNGMGGVSDLGDGTIRVEMGMRKWRTARPLRPGDIALMRSGYRPSPGISLCRAHDTLMEDCTWHGGDGMGLVAQRCENVTLRGSGRAADRTAGAFARKGGGYATALQADATHFSNCKGLVLVENCFFEATVDDAINVHSTCLKIESVPKPDTLVCRYMHRQSTGFEVFLPGERLRFIKAATLEPGAEAVVKDARIIDPRTAVITLAEPVPQGYGPGDAVENADWQPAVVFRNNIARKICARTVLLTTPGKTVIEGNLFDRVSSQVIQLEGDASGWYESGACRDVTIRNNVFRDCAFLRGEGIVQIRPNLKDIKSQKERYHRNIVIERNRFETPRIPLLRACSVSNLVWRDNEVIYNDNFPARGNEPFVIDYSEDLVLK